MFIPISQVSTNLQLNKYEGHEQKKSVTSGGNALLHAADWIFQFKPKTSGQLILEGEGQVDLEKNKVLGNNARLMVVKSPNETTGYSIEYPIKKGRGVWREREVLDTLVSVGAIEKAGSWFKSNDKIIDTIKTKFDKDIPPSIQGKAKLTDFFEANPDITEFYYNQILKAIQNQKVSKDTIMEEISDEEKDDIRGMAKEALKPLEGATVSRKKAPKSPKND